MARYTYQHEETQEILRREISGVDSFGRNHKHVVTVINRLEQDDPSGKWVVMVDGVASLWYGMESAALRAGNRYKIGAYGITHGLPACSMG